MQETRRSFGRPRRRPLGPIQTGSSSSTSVGRKLLAASPELSWTESFGLVESLAADFSSCSVKDYSFNVSVASASNASNTTSGGGGRRLNVPLVESCSFKDRVSD